MENLRQLFLRHVAQTSPSPISLDIESASGVYLTDRSGKKYIDLISGIAVSNLGHNNTAINAAIKKQVDSYLHLMVYGEFIEAPQVLLAKKLSEMLPANLSSVYFLNSGAEAIEGTLKLAKRYTGRTEIIAFENAYHGSTHGALSICGNEELKNSFRPLLPGIKHLPFNAEEYLSEISVNTACVMIEPIQGESGVHVSTKEYLSTLRKKCDETGTLLVFDEIQTGMGRTGKLFAFEHYGITPDILVLGKAFGGGMPLAAFISSPEIMSSLTHDPVLGHISTFGGHPVSCAAALTSLEELTSGRIIDSVAEKEHIFRKNLNHSLIKEIRGKGLILSLQFENEQMNKKVINLCLEHGVLADWFLFAPDCMRIAPPLIISEEEIMIACKAIKDSLNSILN